MKDEKDVPNRLEALSQCFAHDSQSVMHHLRTVAYYSTWNWKCIIQYQLVGMDLGVELS